MSVKTKKGLLMTRVQIMYMWKQKVYVTTKKILSIYLNTELSLCEVNDYEKSFYVRLSP